MRKNNDFNNFKLLIIILQSFYKLKIEKNMGNYIQCCQQKDKQYLQKQLKIYQWRADYKRNKFIPRVTFKKKYQLQKEGEFIKFVQQTGTRNYIDPALYANTSSNLSNQKNKEVIVFQNYVCTLQNINGILNLEEIIYVLYGLITGFKELKMYYDQFIVSEACCFVTNNGEVRAWINYNPKLNNVEKNHHQQTYLAEQENKILYKIVNILSKCSQKCNDSIMLFTFLRQNLTKIQQTYNYNRKQANIFNSFCQIIDNYTRLQKIIKTQNISTALKKVRDLAIKRKFKNIDATQQTRKSCLLDDQLPTCASFIDTNRNNQNTQLIKYSKDQHLENYFRNNKLALNSSNYFLKLQTQPILMTKSIFGSYTQRPVLNQSHFQNNNNLDKNNRLQQCKAYNIHEILQRNSYPINDSQSFSLNYNKSNNMRELEGNTNLNPNHKKSQRVLHQNTSLSDYLLSESQSPQYLMTSNLYNNQQMPRRLEQVQMNIYKYDRNSKNHNNQANYYNTFQQIPINKYLNESKTQEKPWMHSTRTISKLICQQPQQNNVLMSQGSTSSYNSNYSDYSGILLNMGRSISDKIIQ